jgi:prevent-host-death family protein
MAPTYPAIRLPHLRRHAGRLWSFWSRMTHMISVAVAEAKARFSELIDRASRGERFLVVRHGRPAAALVPVPPDPEPDTAHPTTGLAALAGIIEWDEFAAVMEEVVADRENRHDTRPVPTFD